MEEWQDRPVKLVVYRFPQDSFEHTSVTDWLIALAYDLATDDRVEEVIWNKVSDTPVTMSRNRAAQFALEQKADLLLMVDNDMAPDCELRENPTAKPFFDSSLEFWRRHRRAGGSPCIIGAPYCSAPPYEGPLVARWQTQQNDCPEPDFIMKLYSREEALYEAGITRVAALPTGLMLTDVEVFRGVPQPHFYYEWKDNAGTEKLGTEDITFTRDADFAGFPLFCNWDAWAGHWKRKLVRKPRALSHGSVPWKLREAYARDLRARGTPLPPPGPVEGDRMRTV